MYGVMLRAMFENVAEALELAKRFALGLEKENFQPGDGRRFSEGESSVSSFLSAVSSPGSHSRSR